MIDEHIVWIGVVTFLKFLQHFIGDFIQLTSFEVLVEQHVSNDNLSSCGQILLSQSKLNYPNDHELQDESHQDPLSLSSLQEATFAIWMM